MPKVTPEQEKQIRELAEDWIREGFLWKAYELWEFAKEGCLWQTCHEVPNFTRTDGMKFRRKPRRLSVTLANGEQVSWDEPMRDAPEKIGTPFFWVALDGCVYEDSWSGGITDCSRLEQDICHLTESAALEHLEAMRKINGQGG
jgi:hypothetical protein